MVPCLRHRAGWAGDSPVPWAPLLPPPPQDTRGCPGCGLRGVPWALLGGHAVSLSLLCSLSPSLPHWAGPQVTQGLWCPPCCYSLYFRQQLLYI